MNPKQLLNIRANRAKLSLILQSLFPFGIHSLSSPSAQNTTFRPPPSLLHRDLSQMSFEMLPYSRFSMIFGTIFFTLLHDLLRVSFLSLLHLTTSKDSAHLSHSICMCTPPIICSSSYRRTNRHFFFFCCTSFN